MKRLFWLGVGLAAGALVARAVTRRASSYTPQGLAAAARDSARNLVGTVQDFVDEVRDGMHERERELQDALVDGSGLAEWEELVGRGVGEADFPAGPTAHDHPR
jgi:hypothetical protein